jgi:SAM-dependent methyltransferase
MRRAADPEDPVAAALRADPEVRRRLEAFYTTGAYVGFREYWAFERKKDLDRHLGEVSRRLALVDRLASFRPIVASDALVVGGGLGAEAIALALRGARAFAVDVDPAAIEFATWRARYYGVSPRCLRAQACELPFPDRSFGVVLLRQLLEHLPCSDQRRALAEAGRVTLPGGIVFVDAPNRFDPIDRHDSGLPLVHWLPRRLALPIVRALGRAVPTFEPGADGRRVDLHDLPTFRSVFDGLRAAGAFRCLTRYKFYRDPDEYLRDRSGPGRPSLRLRAKRRALRLADALVGLNRVTPIRAVFVRE